MRSPFISIGPRVRKSPFFDLTVRYGAQAFTVYNHMYLPTVYTDSVSEYWSLVTDVTVWDVSCQRQVEISGPDALKLVQLLTPRDMSGCQVGQCQYMVLTDDLGGIVNDAVLLRIGENRFWLSPGDGDVLLWASGVAVASGFDVNVIEPDVSPLQLQGPKSPHVARELFGDDILGMKYYWLKETTLDGIPLVVSRTGWSGELGFELYLRDAKMGEQLWERIMSAGKPYDIVPIAPNRIRSVEGGLLSYASDITRDDNPFTLGFDWMVDFEQEYAFIGRDALMKIKKEGPKRRLVGVEMPGEPLAAPNDAFWQVRAHEADVGHVTRIIYSPRLKRNIGYANVPIEFAEVGTELTLGTTSGYRNLLVCDWPFVPAIKKMPQDLTQAR